MSFYHYLAGSWDTSYVKDLNTGVVTDVVFAGGGFRIGKVQGGVNYYYHLDRLGSVRLVTQTPNVEAFTAKYLPYGISYATSGTENFQYTGKQLDVSTGLYYYGYRYYDGQSGRFITVDIHRPDYGNPQDLNRYIYALDNPNVHIDPTGLYDPGYLTQAESDALENLSELEDYGNLTPAEAEAASNAGINYDTLSTEMGLLGNDAGPSKNQIMSLVKTVEAGIAAAAAEALAGQLSNLGQGAFYRPPDYIVGQSTTTTIAGIGFAGNPRMSQTATNDRIFQEGAVMTVTGFVIARIGLYTEDPILIGAGVGVMAIGELMMWGALGFPNPNWDATWDLPSCC